jgi:Caspase domain
MKPPDRERSRAVLVGIGSYEHKGLPDYPEIRQNVMDLYQLPTDPERGTFLRENCEVLLDEADQKRLGDKLQKAAEEAQDLLLVYYAGHGLLDEKRRELHLALSSTKPTERVIGFSALPFARVRDACLDSAARSRVVILDCCYSGRAIYGTQSDQSSEVLAQIDVRGTYTLTSSPANGASVVVPGELHTAFTGRLLRVLRDEEGAGTDPLTLRDVFERLRTTLNADGLPRPLQCTTENAEQLVLVRPPAPDRTRAGQEAMLAQARRQAATITAQADELLGAAEATANDLIWRAEDSARAARQAAEAQVQAVRAKAADEAAAREAAAEHAAAAQSEHESAARALRQQAERELAEARREARAIHGRSEWVMARITSLRTELADYEAARARLRSEIDDLAAQQNRFAAYEIELSDTSAAEIWAKARRSVTDPEALRDLQEVIDRAVAYAQAVRQEAVALYEDKLASASAAATGLETELAVRREQSERDLAARQAEVEGMRTSARRQADDIVTAALAETQRIRSDHERKIAALTRSRDLVDTYLRNTYETLITLVGGVDNLKELLPDLDFDGGTPLPVVQPTPEAAPDRPALPPSRASGSGSRYPTIGNLPLPMPPAPRPSPFWRRGRTGGE